MVIILLYIFLVFFVSRFVIPHMGFGEDRIPEKLPETMKDKIDELKFLSSSPKEFLELSYKYIGEKNWSERLNTFFKFGLLFKDLDSIWKVNGYVPCTQSSFLMRIFLLKSGFFKPKEIRRRYVFVNFIVHQYLEVYIEDKWVPVDVGEKKAGIPIGKHLKYFG